MHMKKILLSVIALMLLLAVCVTACADGWTMYVNANGVKVYKEPKKSSSVLRKFDGNDKVTAVDEVGGWTKISFKKDGKKKTGWIENKYLSETQVQSRCKHKFGSWEIVNKPTCTSVGYRVRYCKKCGIMDEGEVPKAEHNYGKWKVTKEPTCTRTGEQYRVCKDCKHKQTKEIPKVPHEYGKWNVTLEATCTRTGERYHVCQECGYKEVETIKKKPHSYGAWIVTLAATCTEEGEHYRICEVCGNIDEQVIKKLPHDYEWEIITPTTDHSSGTRCKVCQVCFRREREESFDPEGTLRRGAKGASVREIQMLLADQGYLKASGVDGKFGGGLEKAIMSFQKDQGLDPDGIAWPQTINRLHHDFGPWQTVKAATRFEAGERVRVCTECGYMEREQIDVGGTFKRKQKGESIRTIQKLLKQSGYDAGSLDGSYGAKLDKAYAAFAAANGIDFADGELRPGHLDALVNAWLEKTAGSSWMGSGDLASPVNLALTLTQVPSSGDPDVRDFSWSLTNLGSSKCTFCLLLMSRDKSDFTRDTQVMVIDGIDLKPNGNNNAHGTFNVVSGWDNGPMYFTAVAVENQNDAKWVSNVVTIDIGE